MTTITNNDGTIYFRDDLSGVQYSTDQTTWFVISLDDYPLTITNNNPNSNNVLTVLFTTDMSFTANKQYFICGSNYITFDGNNHTITIDDVDDYPGLIECGSDSADTQRGVCSFINVKNINVASDNGSKLRKGSGWVCAAYFGKFSDYVRIEKCSSSGNIGNSLTPSCGGIMGHQTGRKCTGPITVINCFSTGDITNSSGGIFAQDAGREIVTNSSGSIYVNNCYSRGTVDTSLSGGIFGFRAGRDNSNPNLIQINNCYSYYGSISGTQSVVTQSNIYTPYGSWNDGSANLNLLGYPTSETNPGDTWAYDDTGPGNPYILKVFYKPPPLVCFNADSKILTDKGYIPIKNLKNGDLIQTLRHGYIPINMIGKTEIHNPALKHRIKDQLYKCSPDEYPEIFEPLIITGCHCILVDDFISEEQRKNVIDINKHIYVTDHKYRLPACADSRASIHETSGKHTIYHLALDNDDYYMNYGIFANGLLVETTSKRYLKELSNMDLIE